MKKSRSRYLQAVLMTVSLSAVVLAMADQLSASEPPKKTSEIKVLTPGQAATVTEDMGIYWLQGLTSLTLETAETLAKRKGTTLYLDGLTSMTPEVAEVLSKFNGGDPKMGGMLIIGLTDLSPEVAEGLAKHEGYLLFSHLASTALTVVTAEILAKHEGKGLALPALTELTPEMAEALSKHRGGKAGASWSYDADSGFSQGAGDASGKIRARSPRADEPDT
ncbi:MAG: hypothetical protein P1U77_25645 [Rubripirellula sp.]|nr:hypothetical protein [Rubripirellula sp.]